MSGICARKFSACCAGAFLLFALFLSAGCDQENNHLKISDLIEHFKKCGLKIESVRPLEPSFIMADSAACLDISGRGVGIYKYDINITKQRVKLEKIYHEGFVYIVGMKFPVKLNGSFVMIDYEANTSRKEIISAFESFK